MTYTCFQTLFSCKRWAKTKSIRLEQNITQESLAESTLVNLSTIKRIEKGKIGSFENMLRLIREQGLLDLLYEFIKEDRLSLAEEYKIIEEVKKKKVRKRDVGKVLKKKLEESEW